MSEVKWTAAFSGVIEEPRRTDIKCHSLCKFREEPESQISYRIFLGGILVFFYLSLKGSW